jgi:hypothetical protein
VVYTCNLSIEEAKAGGSQVQIQHGLHSKTHDTIQMNAENMMLNERSQVSTKDHILLESIDRKRSELANPKRQKAY